MRVKNIAFLHTKAVQFCYTVTVNIDSVYCRFAIGDFLRHLNSHFKNGATATKIGESYKKAATIPVTEHQRYIGNLPGSIPGKRRIRSDQRTCKETP
jgi:hypothetical protein